MYWTSRDIAFLDLLLATELDDVIQSSTQRFQQTPSQVFPAGTYDSTRKQFIWHPLLLQETLSLSRKYDSLWGNRSTIDKLLQPTVSLPYKYRDVIGYLLLIMNASYHVIRYPVQGLMLYALVKLPGAPTEVDFPTIEEAMFAFRTVYDKPKRMTGKTGKRKTGKTGKRMTGKTGKRMTGKTGKRKTGKRMTGKKRM